MAKTLTISQFADRLSKLGKDLNKAVLPPFRVNLKIMRDALYAEYWQSDFGAKIWKWYREKKGAKSGPAIKLGRGRRPSYARWSTSEQAFIGIIRVEGLSAKIEEGGRLEKHVIFGRAEREPGVIVPRRPVMNRVLDNLWDKTIKEVSDEFGKFVERTL